MSVDRGVVGLEGEKLVAEYFKTLDRKVITHDWFDMEKDLTIGGKNVEVKSQTPWVTEDAFTLRHSDKMGRMSNDWPKCIAADLVVFCSIPNGMKPHKSENKIYIIEGKQLLLDYRKKRTLDGRIMYLVPIFQPNMKFLCNIPKEAAMVMKEHSPSEWSMV